MAIIEKQEIQFRQDRKLRGRAVNLGNEGDNLVRRLVFDLPEVSGQQTATLLYGGAYADMIQLTPAEGKWVADLTAEMVGAAGEAEGYVRVDGPGGEVWRSDAFRIETGDIPDIEVQIEKLYPTAVNQMLTAMAAHSVEMEEQVKRAEDAADRAEAAGGEGGGEGGGESGKPGADGVGIESVEQTTTSTEDGGVNVVTVTKTDGTTHTFEVRNGSRGATGTAGQDGKDGRPGAPGSDASVTAKNIALALGYTPADAEKVNELSEEMTDQFADRYTKAETNAAIEEATRKEPEWEVIRTAKLVEGTRSVAFSDLHHRLLRLEFIIQNEGGEIVMPAAVLSVSGITGIVIGEQKMSAGAPMYRRIELKIEDGLIMGSISYSRNIDSSYGVDSPLRKSYNLDIMNNWKKITSVTCSVNSGGDMPAGTEVVLKGVRADA